MKRSVYILFILLMGCVGAVLRGLSLVGGIEPETGLPVAGNVPALALKLVCAAVVILAAVLCRSGYGGAEASYERLLSKLGKNAQKLCVLCGAALAVVGVAGLCSIGSIVAAETNDHQPFGVPALAALTAQWILCAVSGLTLAWFAQRQDGHAATKRQGICISLPMFWTCLSLIMTYHENSSNPVMQDYAYDLLLVIALMAAFYFMAGTFFAQSRPVCIALFAGLSVFLTLTCAGGLLLATLWNPAVAAWTLTDARADFLRMAACVCAGLYLLVQLQQLGKE